MDKIGCFVRFAIKDLDEVGKKAAEYVLKNLPEKKLSATALLIPKLPEVPVANAQIVQKASRQRHLDHAYSSKHKCIIC